MDSNNRKERKNSIMDDDNDNKVVEEVRHPEYEFKFNFINMPWDDRSTKSKVGIISLLVAIFVATMGMVAHNFYIHFTTTSSGRRGINNEIKCHLVKADELSFAARIHLMETQELLCVGAMISYTSVLANGVCTKSGPVYLRLGSSSIPLCKKGFRVKSMEPILHDGAISKLLVVLTTYESMSNCGEIIKIGNILDHSSPATIVGRPLPSGKLLSQQPAKLTDADMKQPGKRFPLEKTICVTDLAKCPVKAGDLLVQNGFVYGLASTSIHMTESNKIACFADLRLIREELIIVAF